MIKALFVDGERFCYASSNGTEMLEVSETQPVVKHGLQINMWQASKMPACFLAIKTVFTFHSCGCTACVHLLTFGTYYTCHLLCTETDLWKQL